MIITQEKVRFFLAYRGNIDRWSSSPNAERMSYDEWNLMEELLRRKMHYQHIAQLTPYSEDEILSFCDNLETATQLQDVIAQLADPSNVGLVERIVRFFVRSRSATSPR